MNAPLPRTTAGKDARFCLALAAPSPQALQAQPTMPFRSYRITFRGETRGLVKDLPGFRKHHRVPALGDRGAGDFLCEIGSAWIEEQGHALFRQLRTAFQLRRTELRLSLDAGIVDLETPGFTARLRLATCDDSHRHYLLVTEVDEVSDPEALRSAAFDQVFAGAFDSVVCAVGQPIAVADVIDRVEAQSTEGTATVDYPPDASRCVVSLTGLRTKLYFAADAVTLLAKPRASIAELLTAADALPRLLGLDEPEPGPPA